MLPAVIIAIIGGATATFQTSVNRKAGEVLRSPYLAAAVSNFVASALLMIITLASEGGINIPFAEINSYPAWIWLGGVCGAIVVLSGIVCLPVLGSAKNIMLVCTGQLLAGLAIDNFGLFGSIVKPMTLLRLAGAALVLAGIALVSLEKSGAGDKKKGNSEAFFVMFALLNGAAAALQTAVNGTLSRVVGSIPKTSLVSLTIAFLCTIVAVIVIYVLKGKSSLFMDGKAPERFRFHWAMLLGGALAFVIVGGNAFAGSVMGTGIATIMIMVGAISTGLFIDAAGVLGIEKKPVTARKIVGMCLLIAGAALISLF